MSALPISVVINTKNSEATLPKALESVKDFAKQIVVMDMRSEDKTRQIAQKFTTDVFKTSQDFDYVEPARNEALSKATQPWIFILDADEEVSEGLKKEMKELIQISKGEADCYFIPRKNIIFDREMIGTGWWPDYQMRLFKKDKVSWSSQIHSVPEIHGKVEHLPVDSDKAIIHHNFQKVDQFIERLNRYTSIESASQLDSKNLSAALTFKTFKDEFLRRLFQQKGIDEGIHGMGLSLLQSMYQVAVEMKKWEKNGFQDEVNEQQKVIQEIRLFEKDLNYWIADWKTSHSPALFKGVWLIRRKLKW